MSATSQVLRIQELYFQGTGRELEELHVTDDDLRALQQEAEGNAHHRSIQVEYPDTVVAGVTIKVIGSPVSTRDYLVVIGLGIEEDRMRTQDELGLAMSRIDKLVQENEGLRTKIGRLETKLQETQKKKPRPRGFGRYFN